jgi:hypothetical protein
MMALPIPPICGILNAGWYKNHVKADAKSKFLEGRAVTDASLHDLQKLADLVATADGEAAARWIAELWFFFIPDLVAGFKPASQLFFYLTKPSTLGDSFEILQKRNCAAFQ